MRYLLLLRASGENPMTERRLCTEDFICTYAHDFGLSSTNLNGNSNYRYGEYAARCSMAGGAIKHLLLRGLVMIQTGIDGYSYWITNAGIAYYNRLDSEYARRYSALACAVVSHFVDTSDTELIHLVLSKTFDDRRNNA